MNRSRKSRFGGDPASRLTYTPTVSRALIEETEAAATGDRLTPSDFVPAGRESWEDIDYIPAAGDSDLPLPKFTQVDGDEAEMIPVARLPRDSLDLGADDMAPPAEDIASAPPRLPRDSLDLGSDSLVPEPGAEAVAAQPEERSSGRAAMVSNEHPLWVSARAQLSAEQRDAAADTLERLCLEQPQHEPARTALLQLSVILGRHERVGVHTAWLLRGQLQSGRASDACVTYQRVRAALPQVILPEAVLVAALSAADGTSTGAVVLDATNMLLKHHAASPQAPRALLLCAKHQFMSGASEAGVQTLRYLVANFSSDAAAELARRKLTELGQ